MGSRIFDNKALQKSHFNWVKKPALYLRDYNIIFFFLSQNYKWSLCFYFNIFFKFIFWSGLGIEACFRSFSRSVLYWVSLKLSQIFFNLKKTSSTSLIIRLIMFWTAYMYNNATRVLIGWHNGQSINVMICWIVIFRNREILTEK